MPTKMLIHTQHNFVSNNFNFDTLCNNKLLQNKLLQNEILYLRICGYLEKKTEIRHGDKIIYKKENDEVIINELEYGKVINKPKNVWNIAKVMVKNV